MKRLHNLKRFVRAMCANYYEGRCVYGKACTVIRGKMCGYFEKAVLHKPNYPYPHKCFIEDPAFEEPVRYEYRLIGGAADGAKVKARRCECGATLRKGQRVCAKCRAKKRRKTYRDAQRKRRAKKRYPDVNS